MVRSTKRVLRTLMVAHREARATATAIRCARFLPVRAEDPQLDRLRRAVGLLLRE